jgi:ribonucleoside-diphosphate reductase alpha chain
MTELDPAIENILKQRYYQEGEDWEALCHRVAKDLADTKKQELEFFDVLYNRHMLPNSPTLMNAGTGLGNYSACYVLPMTDSMEDIMKTASDTVMIHKNGGGTGFDFSRIRPMGAKVKSTNGVASGPVSFMKMVNDITDQVKQGGRRRGANMGILRIDHPDILKFIRCKHDETFLVNFNISVAMTDDFIEAVTKDGRDPWICYFDDKSYTLFDDGTTLERGDDGLVLDDALTAKDIWNIIVDSAWSSGDPGIVFIDRINQGNPLRYLDDYKIRATNPCGEQPLADYGSCNLVAINLSNLCEVGRDDIDWKLFDSRIKIATEMADSVIEKNQYPVKEVEEYSVAKRNIGVGLMGFHDMLLKLGIRYDSSEARAFAGEVMKRIYMVTFETSVALAKNKGHFEGWSMEYPLLVDLDEFPDSTIEDYKKYGLRNCCLTTIAPTGSIGLIAGCSTGIEPHFADKIWRRDATNPDGYWVVNPVIDQCREKWGDDVFISAQELDAKSHIMMQAAAQLWCDSGISKTINLPNSATKDDVSNCYKLAIENGCKGITIYRDGCKTWQVLSSTADNVVSEKDEITALDIPDVSDATRFKIKDPETGKNIYVIITHVDSVPFEIFATGANMDHQRRELWDAITRQISLNFKYQVPADDILEQLEKSKTTINGLPNLISKTLKQFFQKNGIEMKIDCPECGAASYVLEGGCGVCKGCGFSECS